MQISSCAEKALGQVFTVFGGEWSSDPSLRKWVRSHCQTYAAQLANLAASMWPVGRGRRKAQDAVLASESARVCCLITAAGDQGVKLTKAECEMFAGQIRPWTDCGETITAHFVPKGDGSFRATVKFGFKRSAMSYLCRDLLGTVWGTPGDEINWKRRGSAWGVNIIKNAIENDRPWIGTADIQSCFSSFTHDGIRVCVPLSAQIIRCSILIPEEAEIVSPSGSLVSSADRDTLRQGLPQGAPASSFVASHLLSQSLQPIAFDNFVVRYADDILWACGTEVEAVAMLHSLKACLGSHPAGEFTLHKAQVSHTDFGARFIGYKIKTLPDEETYVAHAFPNAESFKRFWGKLGKQLEGVPLPERDTVALGKLDQWLKAWGPWVPSTYRLNKLRKQALTISQQQKPLMAKAF